MKNDKKEYEYIEHYSFLWTRPTDPWCNMLQTLEKRRKYIGIILSNEHSK